MTLFGLLDGKSFFAETELLAWENWKASRERESETEAGQRQRERERDRQTEYNTLKAWNKQ